MDEGLLWFDNDRTTTLVRKVDRAAAHYRKKFGRPPSLCYVHPTMCPEASRTGPALMAGRVEIRTAPWVLPNHYFIGENGEKA